MLSLLYTPLIRFTLWSISFFLWRTEWIYTLDFFVFNLSHRLSSYHQRPQTLLLLPSVFPCLQIATPFMTSGLHVVPLYQLFYMTYNCKRLSHLKFTKVVCVFCHWHTPQLIQLIFFFFLVVPLINKFYKRIFYRRRITKVTTTLMDQNRTLTESRGGLYRTRQSR